ncbi:hypothetical protein ACFWY9_38990 [Amycolatopsis sp. NPDC059027]|uniref:hypothetical protein n=1 Tax=Amycolatopsis sp. NPDC059027 TaxID=3346709 RepID=UPI00366FA93A
MNPPNRTKWTVSAVAALSCLTIVVPDTAAAGPATDCEAALTARPHWTVRCTSPHTVTIHLQHWWHWLDSTESHYDVWDIDHAVQPGVPWTDGLQFLPEVLTERLCVAAFQDKTVPISPQLCR